MNPGHLVAADQTWVGLGANGSWQNGAIVTRFTRFVLAVSCERGVRRTELPGHGTLTIGATATPNIKNLVLQNATLQMSLNPGSLSLQATTLTTAGLKDRRVRIHEVAARRRRLVGVTMSGLCPCGNGAHIDVASAQ